ncbi:MAG: hypothetical protein QXU20_01935 [Candidatus Woesearchaeota archaeon]
MKKINLNLKSQVGFEFVLLVGIVFLFFGITTYAIIELSDRIRYEAESEQLKDLGLRIKQEIILATNAQDGYYRTFELPVTINGKNYSISVEGSFLVIRTDNRAYYTRIGNFTGFFNISHNEIRRENGVVYLNTI